MKALDDRCSSSPIKPMPIGAGVGAARGGRVNRVVIVVDFKTVVITVGLSRFGYVECVFGCTFGSERAEQDRALSVFLSLFSRGL